MLYNFQIKFNASNENETFEPLEKLYTFYQQSLGSSSDVLSFSFWMAAAAEAAATSFSVWGSKLLLNAVVFSNITHYLRATISEARRVPWKNRKKAGHIFSNKQRLSGVPIVKNGYDHKNILQKHIGTISVRNLLTTGRILKDTRHDTRPKLAATRLV